VTYCREKQGAGVKEVMLMESEGMLKEKERTVLVRIMNQLFIRSREGKGH